MIYNQISLRFQRVEMKRAIDIKAPFFRHPTFGSFVVYYFNHEGTPSTITK